MKTIIHIVFLFVFPLTAFSQNEQSEAVAATMSNTFNLYGDKLNGTCFTITKEGKQYFITAAHLFDSSHKSGDLVPIHMVVQNTLKSFNAKVYFHTNRKVDVAVFKLSEKVSQNVELPEEHIKEKEFLQKRLPGNGIPTDTTFILPAMDVFFLGFPLGVGSEFLGMKLPLVKKAIVSGWGNNNGTNLLLLDGHNNLGFSGGPVVAYNAATKKMFIVAVISGYIPETIDVKQRKETISVSANSGIIVCYVRSYIEDIFTANKKDLQ